MGLIQSVFTAESGYHVHGIQENSPAQRAGLEPFFDFILSVGHARLNKDNSMLKDLLKANIEKPVKMEVYSSKVMKIRELEVIPSNMWGGQGLLGASVRFCTFHGANHNVWHVLEVEPNSPAALAGLKQYSDYIVGADQSEDFFMLIEASEGKALKLLVYNTERDDCREVHITPNGAWGGEGSLGCGIGFGYLHRIPTRSLASKQQHDTHPASETLEERPSSETFLEDFSDASGFDLTADASGHKTDFQVSTPLEKHCEKACVKDDDDGEVYSGEDVSVIISLSENSTVTPDVQKNDSGIHSVEEGTMALNTDAKCDEMKTFPQ
ncbi:Golgi reassembly-stacking protein 1b isoform X2 [Triplophysa dalaica]|uniref:Golgi reassembly-stacking protein 1b isoform X2 n=1 Tax=Triplophysa dalaica TaxID=1582913 RepID=UPI0024DF42AC|nr:Golgi reassembly-stacking protein 1b isoform X2 [Triplophysa dalaica]